MLRVGLTGGIGAGKSTGSRSLAALGAVIVDADLLAREVVAPGTPGLASIVEHFGTGVLGAEGDLDRPSLGRIVFQDAQARTVLNGIVHPLVAARRAELAAAAPTDAIVVEDVPLLVETGAAPGFPLVVVVEADAPERLRRLVEDRGMSPEDARARLAAQASDDERRAVADVLLANPRRPAGAPDPLAGLVETLWRERLLPFEADLRARRSAARGPVALVDPDPGWAAAGARTCARVSRVAGARALDVQHTGSTAVPGLVAKDVIDVQVVVADLETAAAVAEDLLAVGLVREPGRWWDRLPGGGEVDKALASNADPGRAVNCHVRPVSSPAVAHALAFRDALRADAGLRERYVALKRALAASTGDTEAYAAGKSAFVDEVLAQR
ncbi:dephospho-CoA kinase [Kineococcus sp. NBC_00420]|uniref:dephospho-CoA kinase n=1 Tax=Kineococcus sp. NBC_00420 TaxID=2903564 RepID=UPI002E1D3251